MKVPTALFSGGQDTLADPKDVAILLTQVSPRLPLHIRKSIREAGHRAPVCLSDCLPCFLCLQVSNLVFHQHIDHWEHLDFIWGLDAPDVMFPSILKLLQEHR